MATHSSILACEIPWTEGPGGLQSMGLQSRTRLSDSAHMQPYRTTDMRAPIIEQETEVQRGYLVHVTGCHVSL